MIARHPIRHLLLLLSVLALGGIAPAAVTDPRGDAAIQGWAARARQVVPTVTKETGDLGGKSFGKIPDPAKSRHYYVAAEVDAWDFAPVQADPICGRPLPPQLAATHVAMKIRYFQYTDETFTSKVMQTPRLGLMGPVLRGVVGEELVVTFLNRTEFPLSMHPHGVKYDKDSEGAHSPLQSGLGSAVGPGARFTYVWHLDEQSGPLPGEPSSKCWLYHSHVSGDEEANLGLVGCIIVTDPKRARPDGTPNDVDREMASLFMIFSESGFSEADEEAAEGGTPATEGALASKTWAETQQERELGFRYAINGYVFGNLPGLEVNEGERVRWYLFGLGDENDLHSAHWHGLRVVEEGRRRTDVVELLPATMKVADMVADNPGSWLFHCHVAEHMQEGMYSQLTVHPKGSEGVSREPEAAFFGLPKAQESLRITSAEARQQSAAGKPGTCELTLRGRVTVFDAFSVFTAPVRLQVGGRQVALKPDTSGKAASDGTTYHVLNSGRYGVVYGGVMEWEAKLSGEPWRAEMEKLGLTTGEQGGNHAVPVTMSVGDAKHTTTAKVAVSRKPAGE